MAESWGSDGQSHLTPLADLLRDELKKVPKEDISKVKEKPRDKPLTREEAEREIKALFPPPVKPQLRFPSSGHVHNPRQQPFVIEVDLVFHWHHLLRHQPGQEMSVPSQSWTR